MIIIQLKKTTELNANVKFNFTGTSLVIVGYLDSAGSNTITVNIDGTNIALSLSQYIDSGTQYGVIQTIATGLANKEHYCTITNNQDTKSLVIDGINVDDG